VTILAKTGAPAPGAEGAVFKSFADPVAGFGLQGEKAAAFQATLAETKAPRNTGLWVATGGDTPSLKLIAREGAEPPGAPGVKFATFEFLSVLERRGPVFTAQLASGTQRVRGTTDRGCWAMASDGSLRLLFRGGDEVGRKRLRAFSLLGAVPGSHGQRRAWTGGDVTPSLIYRAFYSDGSHGVVTVAMP
jgi:hypothetical protein